jgi:hypothetical protein
MGRSSVALTVHGLYVEEEHGCTMTSIVKH